MILLEASLRLWQTPKYLAHQTVPLSTDLHFAHRTGPLSTDLHFLSTIYCITHFGASFWLMCWPRLTVEEIWESWKVNNICALLLSFHMKIDKPVSLIFHSVSTRFSSLSLSKWIFRGSYSLYEHWFFYVKNNCQINQKLNNNNKIKSQHFSLKVFYNI